MQQSLRNFYPVLIVFFFITVLIFILSGMLAEYNIDTRILYYGNLFFVPMAFISMKVQVKSMHHSNPNVFVRNIMAGMMIKMILTVIAVFAYVSIAGENFNKKGILIALLFYLVYLAIEVRTILKMNKNA